MKNKNAFKDMFVILGTATFGFGLFCYLFGLDLNFLFSRRSVEKTIVLIVFTFTLYYLWGRAGTEKAEALESVRKADEKYHETLSKVNPVEEMRQIGKFCEKWVSQELMSAKMSILLSASVSYDEYEKHEKDLKATFLNWLFVFRRPIGDQTLKRKQIRAMIKADRVKPIILTPGMLLTTGEEGDRDLMIHPKKKKLRRSTNDMLPMLATIFLCVGVSAYVFLGGITIEKILELFFVAYIFMMTSVKGYLTNFKNISVDTVAYRGKQTLRLHEYLTSEFHVVSKSFEEKE